MELSLVVANVDTAMGETQKARGQEGRGEVAQGIAERLNRPKERLRAGS